MHFYWYSIRYARYTYTTQTTIFIANAVIFIAKVSVEELWLMKTYTL
jgi:hypothetical protein